MIGLAPSLNQPQTNFKPTLLYVPQIINYTPASRTAPSLPSSVPSITYYAATLSYRYYVLRQRHTLYLTYLADPTSPSSPYGSLEEAVKARYASLRCLFTRRFLNVTWEWREQGIWEWLFHQVVWKPLTGRVWWNGGYPAKASLQDVETADEAVLPVEPLDAARLLAGSRRGRGGAGTSTTTSSSGESESPTITSAHSGRSSADVSDDEHWEKLEVTESIQVDPTPDATGPSTTTSTKEAAASSGSSSSSSEATFTWIGQSTCLVQCDGITILTDPVFSDKPIETFLAPSRLRPPACPLQDLLAMDIVHVCFISHNHFDHLDIEVVRALRNTVRWVVPLGLRQFFLDNGVREDRIEELDWWEEREVTVGPPSSAVSSMTAAASEKEAPDTPQSPRSLTVFCTPAQHWSGRTPLDTNQSLWSGFIVKFPKSGKTFFHCGDTGYSEGGCEDDVARYSRNNRSTPFSSASRPRALPLTVRCCLYNIGLSTLTIVDIASLCCAFT